MPILEVGIHPRICSRDKFPQHRIEARGLDWKQEEKVQTWPLEDLGSVSRAVSVGGVELQHGTGSDPWASPGRSRQECWGLHVVTAATECLGRTPGTKGGPADPRGDKREANTVSRYMLFVEGDGRRCVELVI